MFVLNIFHLLSGQIGLLPFLSYCNACCSVNCQVVNRKLHLLFLFKDVTPSSSKSKTTEIQPLIFSIYIPSSSYNLFTNSNCNLTSVLLLQKVTQ